MKKLKISLPLLLILTLIMSTTTLLNPVAAQDQQFYTMLKVMPSLIARPDLTPPNSIFNIAVRVYYAFDLYGFEFKLKYDKNILNVTNVRLGIYPNGLFPYDSEVWHNETNNDVGYVWCAVSMPKGSTRGVGGGNQAVSGILATISFKVVGYGATVLDLDNTILAFSPGNPDFPGEPMDHVVTDGYFTNTGKLLLAAFTISTTTPIPKEVVTFDASKTYSYYPIDTYFWDFGDGYNATGMTVTHVYPPKKGAYYTATFTVNDTMGNQDSLSVQIHVILPTVELFGFMARPEHYNYSISHDESDAWEEHAIVKTQTLYGKIQNYNTEKTFTATAVFDVYFADGTPLVLGQRPPSTTLAPYGTQGGGDWAVVEYYLYIAAAVMDERGKPIPGTWTGIPTGIYNVVARVTYFDGIKWAPGVRVHTFSFVVSP